jgi:acetyl-CoA C-acetyltransferase
MNRKVFITGWGQITQPKEQTDHLLDPLGLMAEAARKAVDAIGATDILAKIDGIMVIRVMSRHVPSAAKQLAEKIGASPRYTTVSGIGGNSPQSMINKAAGMIARGEIDSVLIAGGETYYPRDKNGSDDGIALFKGLTGDHARDDMIGVTIDELQHGIYLPVHGFPLYETALWAESGLDLDSHLTQHVGNLWSKFSQTAAGNPNAWIRSPRSPKEIISDHPGNRMIAFPYRKFMCSLFSVDLGAAVILMSEEKSRHYRQKGRQPVYFLSGAYTEDRQPYLIQKSNFTQSLPIKTAAQRALSRSNLSLEDIDCFDIYSCFPCSVTIAGQMIGIPENDTRPLALTGGLAFFGGPGNNYSLHAVATLAEAISSGEYDNGMITSLGWFMHKNAVGIYSSLPVETELGTFDVEDEKNFLVGEEPLKVESHASGTGIIETYTIICSKDGTPDYAVIYGKTDQGFRFIAQTRPDPDVFKALTKKCQVGRPVQLKYDKSQNKNIAKLL